MRKTHTEIHLRNEPEHGHKEYKYLYQQMLKDDVIRKAYKKLRKGKTKRKEIQYIDAHLDNEVQKMYDMILNTKPEGVDVPHPELAYKPKKRTPKIIFEHGKRRKIYMPEIHEQWLHHIIVLVLEPIITATAYPYSCGSFPKRGAHYGKRQIERWLLHDPKGTRCFAKMDIRHFYDSIRLKILMRELAIRIKDDWFLYIIGLCLQGFNKGIPLGFYISQWLANYLLEPLDRLITEVLGLPKLQRYMDDIVIFASSKKVLQRAIVEIRKMLGQRFRLKLKHNYQVCKFYYEKGKRKIGRALDFMGFIFYRTKTLIRKNIMLSATRLAKKMERSKEANRGYFHRHIEAMLSYMGWFTCTDTYDCYQSRIKPYIHVGRLKKIISKIKRRQKHEGMDQGKMLRGAAGAAACG